MKHLLALFSLIQVSGAWAGNWHVETLNYDTKAPFINVVHLRAGYLEESPNTPFRGNILYLEGLGDSMMNHQKFFEALTEEGYRVIAFDYMGQGGSDGHMNHTLLSALQPDWGVVVDLKGLEIRTMAKAVWRKFARQDNEKKFVIGWSTGGLAAYQMAHDKWADAVVLIAPGLNPRLIVGDSFSITEQNLACVQYPMGENPHVDPVKPNNALLVPLFAKNLVLVAGLANFWKIDPSIKGLVFLGGQDKFVNSDEIPSTLKGGAPQFDVVTYEDSCHEVHNAQHGQDLQFKTIRFFNSL